MTAIWAWTVVALWIVVLLLTVAVIGLLRHVIPLLTRVSEEHTGGLQVEGLPVGTRVPRFSALTPSGATVHWDPTAVGEDVLYLFLSTGCAPCEALSAEMVRHPKTLPDIRLVVITEEPPVGPGLKLPPEAAVLLQQDRHVSELFRSQGTPHGFVVDPSGVVVTRGVPNRVQDLRILAGSSRGGGLHQEAVDAAAARS